VNPQSVLEGLTKMEGGLENTCAFLLQLTRLGRRLASSLAVAGIRSLPTCIQSPGTDDIWKELPTSTYVIKHVSSCHQSLHSAFCKCVSPSKESPDRPLVKLEPR
jgi:hypothetical protein